MSFEIEASLLERPTVDDLEPKLTQIGQRVKKGVWERSRRGSLGYPELRAGLGEWGMQAQDLPYDTFNHDDQLQVVHAFTLADGHCPVVGCERESHWLPYEA